MMATALHRRRTTMIAGTGVALGLILSGCSAGDVAGEEEVVTLELWSWSGASPAPVALWNETHPDVQVELTEIAGGLGGGYARMQSAIQAGEAPDIGQIEYHVLPSFINTGGLLDLSEYGADSLESQFTDIMWSQVTFSDQVFAVPRDAGPMGLYYRADLFEQYGLTVPTTWDEYAELAGEVRQLEDGSMYLGGFLTDPAWLAALTQQAGSQWFDTGDGSWTVGIDDEASMQVAQYWQSLVAADAVKVENTASPEWASDLSGGTLLTYPAAIWGQLNFNEVAPDLAGAWRAAPLPEWPNAQTFGTQYGGSSFAVFNGTEHAEEATEFVTWLGTDPGALGLLTEFGDYPATLDGQDIPEANRGVEYFGGQNIYPIFQEELNSAEENTSVWGPTMTTVFQDLTDAMTNIGPAGSPNSLEAALARVQDSTVANMEGQGFSVEDGTRD